MIDWEQICYEFCPDGGLRDIYVLEAGLADWQVVIDAIRGFKPQPIYTVNGAAADFPDRVEHIFERHLDGSAKMSIQLLDIVLNCHFFGIDDIEFDLDPREVSGSDHLDAVVGFMKLLGDLTGKTVVLTPEGCIESPILEWNPQTRHVVGIQSDRLDDMFRQST